MIMLKPLNPIAFEIGPISVHWYGICIAFGAFLAYFLGVKNAKRLKVKENDLLDGFIWGVIIGVIGAKVWYVLFNLDLYAKEPLTIITEFGQGLAIQGGVIFATIFAYFYCKKKKINPFKIAELLFPGFLIGQICGRWGNFFNQEAHGGLVPGATIEAQRLWLEKLGLPDFIINQMYIDKIGDPSNPVAGYYHPTFLYESLWNLIGLGIIFLLRKFNKKYWVGDAMFFYFVWYSFGRFFIESLRTDSLYVGSLRTAQVVSIVMFVIGVVGFTLRRIYRVYPMSYCDFNEEN